MKNFIKEFISLPTRKSMQMSDSYMRLATRCLTEYHLQYSEYTRAHIIEFINKKYNKQGTKYTVASLFCRYGKEFELLTTADVNTIKRCFPLGRINWSDENLESLDLEQMIDNILARETRLREVNLRDALSLMLLCTFGMRIGQLTAMSPDDIKIEGDKIKASLIWQKHNSFDTSKGAKFVVTLPMRTKIGKHSLSVLLSQYKALLPDEAPNLIFGRSLTQPISTAGMRKIVHAVGNGVKLPKLHPHQFRHYVGTELTKKYGIEVAGAMLNHSSIVTTQSYLSRESILNKITGD